MTPKDPAPIGRRIAQIRELRGLTAAQLAEAIPSEQITRSILVNIENGRKRDLTSTELALIAAGLQVPPQILLVDLEDPWRRVAIDGLPLPYSEMSAAEYLVATEAASVDPGSPNFMNIPFRIRTYQATSTLVLLRRAEHARFDLEQTERFGMVPTSEEESQTIPRGDGTYLVVRPSDLGDEALAARQDHLFEVAFQLAVAFRSRRRLNVPAEVAARARAVVEFADRRQVEQDGKSRLLALLDGED